MQCDTSTTTFQRAFGMSLGWVDAAHGIMMRAGEVYMEMARKASATGRPVTSDDHWRLYGMIQTAARLSWEAGELMLPHGRLRGVARRSTHPALLAGSVRVPDRTRCTNSTSVLAPSPKPDSVSQIDRF